RPSTRLRISISGSMTTSIVNLASHRWTSAPTSTKAEIAMSQQELFEIDLAGGRAQRTYAKLLSPIAGDLDREFPWDALDPTQFDPRQLERARISWTNSAFNEFCTATAMGQLVEVMGRANVPIDLWGIAASFPLEELLHVELCSRVAMR